MFPIKLQFWFLQYSTPTFRDTPKLNPNKLGYVRKLHFIIPVVHYSNTWNSKPPLFVADSIPPHRPHEDHWIKGNSTWNIRKPHGFYHEKYGCFPWFFSPTNPMRRSPRLIVTTKPVLFQLLNGCCDLLLEPSLFSPMAGVVMAGKAIGF
jgi:hypothetical protein